MLDSNFSFHSADKLYNETIQKQHFHSTVYYILFMLPILMNGTISAAPRW